MAQPVGTADMFLSQDELQRLFQSLTWAVLEMDPALPSSAYAVRVAWPSSGAPSWKHTESVAFLRVVEVDSPINKQRDTRYETYDPDTANQITDMSRVFNVTWVLYGPDSSLWAQTIRERLFYQEFHDLVRVEQVFAVTEVASPQRAPEVFQGQWWERWDLTVTFNEMVRHNWLVAYLKSAEITVSVDQSPMEGIANVAEVTVVHNE